MNFVKAKLFIILCSAVVFLGMVVFVISYLVAAGNKKDLEKIRQACQEVEVLGSKTVHENVIAQLNKNITLVEEDRKEALNRIKETTARPLIHPEVFKENIPVGDMLSHYGRFAEKYCEEINNLIDVVNGGDKPSEADEERIRVDYLQKRGSSATATSIAGAVATIEQSQIDKLIEDECKNRAQNIAVYATPAAFCCYDHWQARPNDERSKMLPEIWYTQIAAWIQEDVIYAVKQINGESTSVYDSPVKRLLGINFGGATPASATSLSSSGTRGSVASAALSRGGAATTRTTRMVLPTYVLIPALTNSAGQSVDMTGVNTMGVDLMGPPTLGALPSAGAGNIEGAMTSATPKHISDNLVNVVHFEIDCVMDSSRIHDFINTLQSEKKYTHEPQADGGTVRRNERNQITVLQLEMDPIDLMMENEEGYYYGSGSMKRLRLICGYIFFRSGYDDIMPPSIKALFGGALYEGG